MCEETLGASTCEQRPPAAHTGHGATGTDARRKGNGQRKPEASARRRPPRPCARARGARYFKIRFNTRAGRRAEGTVE